ncbi:MAG: aspartate/glutamate racemase family protein [Proteobacteria bacterium]|nr:aspartate/glutamate racemase family protein [Pseudomonadota bacterium]
MKRIGMLYPSSGISEREVEKMLPPEISLHVTRIPMNMPTYDSLFHMADSVEEASKLLADAQVEVIAFNCTVGSLIKDKGYDQEIIERINRATGVPATTTTTAIVAGLKALDIKKLILVSPYTELLHQKEKAFLESNGFLVLNDRSLSLSDCFQQYEMEPLRWLEMVIAMQQPQCEGYFISCGGIRVVDVIQQLENELKKPVITSNQSLIWHCLRIMGLQEQIEGFGRLLKTPLIC